MELYKKWAEDFWKFKPQPMDMNTNTAFMTLLLAEMSGSPLDGRITKSGMVLIVQTRAAYVGLKLNEYAAALIAALSDSPGVAVMYLYAIRSRERDAVITVEAMAHMFPMGFPSVQYLSEAWDEQKVGGANLLDFISAADFA